MKDELLQDSHFLAENHGSVKVGVNNALTPSDGNYIYHFPQFQQTHAHNCH
jgi:hypothetical protein